MVLSIITQDKEKSNIVLPIILILDNLRSAHNVGAIIRTAECLNIKEVWFCGYTATPEHPKIVKTAMGTQERIIWKHFESSKLAVIFAKEQGYYVYALETVENAESVYEQKFQDNIAIVLGNEALGVAEETLLLCDKIIMLPVLGWKNSLNVATAAAVTCFEIARQRLR